MTHNEPMSHGGEFEMPPGHLDPERMLAFAHGELGDAEAEHVRVHARDCAECGDELAVMVALRLAEKRVDGGDAADGMTPAHGRHAPPSRLPLALAAASVVFVVALTGLLVSGVFAPQPPELARLATAEPPSEIDLRFLLGPSATDASLERLGPGFALILERRYDDAIAQLEVAQAALPDDRVVATGLGIARYLDGDLDDRTELLLAQGVAAPRDDLSHYATWYLGNFYLRRGDLARATAVLEDIATEPDFPGTWAHELLQRLRSQSP